MAIVECVPNFSEGRRREVVDAIAAEVRGVPGVKLLDVHVDADHNRSVLTFVGEAEAVVEAAVRAAGRAAALIDMNRHRGEHPRIGATDVVPLIPISGADMEGCIQWAHRLGQRLWEEHRIPVYFYAQAALRAERSQLPDIRRGEYEGLKEEVKVHPHRRPDVGGPELHPTAGATAVGARPPLIAFNVNLRSSDLDLAKAIAHRIRESGGGFKALQARGFKLADRGIVQVSMNFLDHRTTDLPTVYRAIEAQAASAGVEIAGSEVVGLIPLDALLDCAAAFLKLEGFRRDQVLEVRVWG